MGSKTKQDQFRWKQKPVKESQFKSEISQKIKTITNIFDSKQFFLSIWYNSFSVMIDDYWKTDDQNSPTKGFVCLFVFKFLRLQHF